MNITATGLTFLLSQWSPLSLILFEADFSQITQPSKARDTDDQHACEHCPIRSTVPLKKLARCFCGYTHIYPCMGSDRSRDRRCDRQPD